MIGLHGMMAARHIGQFNENRLIGRRTAALHDLDQRAAVCGP
jgi:hypothetical protein